MHHGKYVLLGKIEWNRFISSLTSLLKKKILLLRSKI
jgi:hypothetical protein